MSTIQLYHGEALRILRALQDETIDAVITDPPYSSGGLFSSARTADPAKKYIQTGTKLSRPSFSGDNRDQRSWLHWCTLWISECFRLMREGGYFLMFTDWRQLPSTTDALQAGGFVWRGVIAWDKTRAARSPGRGWFRNQCEYVVWGTKGGISKTEKVGPLDGCVRFAVRQSDKFHLTGKPTPLMEHLVQIVPAPTLILDPFMGHWRIVKLNQTTEHSYTLRCLPTGLSF